MSRAEKWPYSFTVSWFSAWPNRAIVVVRGYIHQAATFHSLRVCECSACHEPNRGRVVS
jgi:hypothetical protein